MHFKFFDSRTIENVAVLEINATRIHDESLISSAEKSAKNESSASDLLEQMDSDESGNKYQYSIWVSFAEIYNEQIYDLLDEIKVCSNGRKQRRCLKLTDDSMGNVYIKGILFCFVCLGSIFLSFLSRSRSFFSSKIF